MKDLREVYPIAEDLTEYLEANAYSVDQGQHYQIELTPEEILAKKDELAENMIELSKVKQELEEIKAEFKSRIQPTEKVVESTVEIIKTGKEPRTGTLYLLADHDTGQMHVFNDEGRMVYNRPLSKNEKQLKIQS